MKGASKGGLVLALVAALAGGGLATVLRPVAAAQENQRRGVWKSQGAVPADNDRILREILEAEKDQAAALKEIAQQAREIARGCR